MTLQGIEHCKEFFRSLKGCLEDLGEGVNRGCPKHSLMVFPKDGKANEPFTLSLMTLVEIQRCRLLTGQRRTKGPCAKGQHWLLSDGAPKHLA